ncbi:hypothetical protein PHYSODRAFT_331492 [Phytophthora sojae]|uniref:Uncharacterized protein n=1 Tax=Phytophthora sojae (strain P6497) TaxID=1094619 RepID=G4ZG50_PHYSP|nr:hypothetical protein PHYSODRAFT_331492 [Phytophthora sojae]EGZ17534.1 hypothetical protein PHYSODRAFT_331492 [Phytophthora sojae]|eukprot:XP_009526592.1 hypothetical protein PHYSODRAFT_331492 [Phytophthora sojae]
MRGSRRASGYLGSTFGSDAELQAPIRSPPLPTAVARKLSRAQAVACARYEHVHVHDYAGHGSPRLKHNRRFDTQPFATVFVLTDPIYWDAVLPIGLLFLYTIKNDSNDERENIPLDSA